MDGEYEPRYCKQCGFLLTRQEVNRHMCRCASCRAEARSFKQAQLRAEMDAQARRLEQAEKEKKLRPILQSGCARCVFGNSCGGGVIFCTLPYCIKSKSMR